jgi:cation:H+ antiporter
VPIKRKRRAEENELFEDLLLNILILIVSLLILNESSDLTIKNSVRVADITGIGKTTVGFILIAFSTSLPELFVSIFAAIGQESIGVAIGNVLGSNIVNICLILGICFLLAVIKCPNYTSFYPNMAKEEIGSLYFGIFAASVVPLILLYLGYASRFIGVVLLAIFIFYVYQLSKIRKAKEEGSLGEERRRLGLYVFLTLLGVAGVIISSNFIVSSAKFIADMVGIPPVVIGSTIVAFGTSLPELATSIGATRKGHLDLALGNIVGSCFINITCILGVSLVASNFVVNIAAFSKLAMFSLIVNLFLWYFLSSEKISWRESAVLLFMYFIFLTVSFGGYET